MGLAAGIAAAGVAASVGSTVANSASAGSAASTSNSGAQQAAANLQPYNTAGQSTLPSAVALANNNNYGTASNALTASGQYLANSNQAFGQQQQAVTNEGSSLINSMGDQAAAGGQIATGNSYLSNAAAQANLLAGGMSQQTLDNTPGYQFTLQQGLESSQNSAAARGLATSGAALKASDTYATGLANNTYASQAGIIQNAEQDYSGLGTAAYTGADASLNQSAQALGTASGSANQAAGYGSAGTNSLLGSQAYNALNTSQQANLSGDYSRLSGLSSLGENAAAGQGNAYESGANALASGQVAQGTAISQGLTGLGSAGQTYSLYSSLLNGGGTNALGSTSDPYFGGAGA